jgi:hypothetical protein
VIGGTLPGWRAFMFRYSAMTAVCVSFLLVTTVAFSKDKQRQWQTGKVLDTTRDRTYVGNVENASGTATSSGNSTYAQASGSSTAVYRVYETYAIEAGDYVYVCQEHIKWRWSKPALLTVNGPVQFAIEKDHIYIKSEDGTEHETTIVKKVLKAQPPSASPSTPKN